MIVTRVLEVAGVIYLCILTVKILGYCFQKMVWNVYFDKGIDGQFRTLNQRVWDLERKVGIGLGSEKAN